MGRYAVCVSLTADKQLRSCVESCHRRLLLVSTLLGQIERVALRTCLTSGLGQSTIRLEGAVVRVVYACREVCVSEDYLFIQPTAVSA